MTDQAEGHREEATYTTTNRKSLSSSSSDVCKAFQEQKKSFLILRTGEWVYLDRPPAWKKNTTESAPEDPSRKLVSKREGRYRFIKEHAHTVMIDI